MKSINKELNDLKLGGRSPLRIVFWGTYDTGKPRNRIFLKGLRENGIEVLECHENVWRGIEDKSQVDSWSDRFYFLVRWLKSYPILIWKYLKMRDHDAAIVGYLGHLDVLVLWPFANMRRKPVIWDAFISLHDTLVDDRQLLGRRNPFSFFLYLWEWLACRACSLLILDTEAHGRLFMEKYKVKRSKVCRVFVGAEADVFKRRSRPVPKSRAFNVLFYGQFIPLHGIATIIESAILLKHEDIDWVLIGKGQDEPKIMKMLDATPLPRVRWIPWVQYNELIDWIEKADVGLGIFSSSKKAGNVIPNKVFQMLAAGLPLITRDSVAIRELVTDDDPGIILVPPEDAVELANAVKKMRCDLSRMKTEGDYHRAIRPLITEFGIGRQMVEVLEYGLERA